MKTNKFSGDILRHRFSRCHPRPTTHGFRLLRPRPPLRHNPVALLRRHGLHPRRTAVLDRRALPHQSRTGRRRNRPDGNAARRSVRSRKRGGRQGFDSGIGPAVQLMCTAPSIRWTGWISPCFTMPTGSSSERIETGYGYLCVEGTLDGKPTAVLLTRGDRYAAELLEELRERTPGIRILCAGKLPSGTAEKLSLRDALAPAERRGRGNAYARGGWWLHDRILTDTALTVIRADVFARRDLLDPRSGTPLPTYRRQRYTGGIGRYFPNIFIY